MRIINDRLSGWWLALAGVFNLGQWLTVATWPPTQVAPLHYTIYFGLDLTGPAWQLYVLPGVGAMVIVVHGVIAALRRSELWSRSWSLLALVNIVLLSAALLTLRILTTR